MRLIPEPLDEGVLFYRPSDAAATINCLIELAQQYSREIDHLTQRVQTLEQRERRDRRAASRERAG